MGRHCTVCYHPERAKIDAATLGGKITRPAIARQWGVSVGAQQRHRPHLAARIQREQELADRSLSSPLEQMQALHVRTLQALDRLEHKKAHTFLFAVREARANVELIARLLGELQDGVNLNIMQSPEVLTLVATVTRALEPYPEAVVAALRALGHAPADARTLPSSH
jgi:hypothetical protein